MQNQGSRPVYRMNPATDSFEVFTFSGMVPSQRLNAGVKVCTPDAYVYMGSVSKWSKLKCKLADDISVIGRKNFAIAHCD